MLKTARVGLLMSLSVSFISGAALCLAQPQPLTLQSIKGGVYLAKGGSGANTGFYAGDKEIVAIDAKMTAESTKETLDQIGKLTGKPVTRIVLTHSDGDHVNGLNGFPQGLKIYAHPQTKRDLEEAAKAPNTPYLRDYLPNELCSPCTPSSSSAMVVQSGSGTIQLYHFGPAHTSGDLIVFFPAERVAFVGDLAFVGRDPLIHRQKGGSSAGLLDTLKGLLALNADTYLSGHSEPLTKQDIQGLHDSLADKRNKVKALVTEGRSLDDIKKAFGIQEAATSPGRPRFPSLVEVIFFELTEKK